MPQFTWNHSTVTAGGTTNVTMSTAPCSPVTVKLMISGGVVDAATISTIPGDCELDVPAGSSGRAYQIVVSCNGLTDSASGFVT